MEIRLLSRFILILTASFTLLIGNDRNITIEQNIAGLYIAYFNRAPDKNGLEYWTRKGEDAKNSGETVSNVLKELSSGFASHPTFTSTYGNLSNREFVEAIYKNVLGQNGDSEGVAYWTGYIDNGGSRSDMVSDFVEASLSSVLTKENFPNLSDSELTVAQERQALISNKVEVGLKFVDILGDKTNISNSSNPESDSAYEASIKILEGVTADGSTVTKKVEFLESIRGDSDPIGRINSYSVAKITVHNRAYSTYNIVGIYLKKSNTDSWGSNYIDFQIHPNYRLSKPIEISNCSEKYDLAIVYENRLQYTERYWTIKCGEEYDRWVNDRARDSDYENTFLYDENSTHKDYLEMCPLFDYYHYNVLSCNLSELSLIAQESKKPTKEQILSRLVVSQKWMGDRFAELLDILDDDIKQLLGAVTAIVIDEDIIPSKYKSSTGAIYLDPRGLWLTSKEAETIIDKDDYRSSYGNELKFKRYWRYIKNGSEYAYRNTDWKYKEHNTTRTIDDIKYGFVRLLYHELAHANDYIPPSSIDTLQSDTPISSITWNNYKGDKLISKKLYNRSPLNSQELIDIAQILWSGKNATEEQKKMNAEDVGLLFENDVANAMYSYSSPREDLAKLFEATMMRYHYGFEMDIGFIDKPTDENPTYKDYILGWGARNRIAEPNIADRAIFVANSILPNETDWSEFFAKDVGKSQLLDAGKNWWDSRIIGNSDTTSRKAMKVPDIREIYFNHIE